MLAGASTACTIPTTLILRGLWVKPVWILSTPASAKLTATLCHGPVGSPAGERKE